MKNTIKQLAALEGFTEVLSYWRARDSRGRTLRLGNTIKTLDSEEPDGRVYRIFSPSGELESTRILLP